MFKRLISSFYLFIYLLTLQPFIHEQIDIKFRNIHIDEGQARLKVWLTGLTRSHIKTMQQSTQRKTTIIITHI